MSIATTDRKAGPFLGDDVTTVFPFEFKVYDKDHLRVILTSSAGVESELVLDTDYTVSLNADQDSDPGGSITYPVSGDPLATGEKLTILTDQPATQEAVLNNMGGFFPKTIEKRLDWLTILVQQLSEKVSRTLAGGPSDGGVTYGLGTAGQRAGKYLRFDANGNAETAAIVAEEVTQGIFDSFVATISNTAKQAFFDAIAGVSAVEQALYKLINPRTAAEISAGVTPVDYRYPEGDLNRYGTNTTPGTTDMRIPLQRLFAVLQPGMTAVIRGNLYLSAPLSVTVPDDVVIDARDAHFRTDFATEDNLITLSGLKGSVVSTTLALDARRGDLAIEVADATGLEAGMIIRLHSQEWFDPAETKRTLETNRIRGVDGTTVYLDAPLLCDFTSAGDTAGGGDGSVAVEAWKVARNVKWIGGTFHRLDTMDKALFARFLSDPTFDGLTFEGEGRYGLYLENVVGDLVHNCRSYNHGRNMELDGTYSTVGQEFGYGILHTHTAFSRVSHCHGGRGWHTFEAADGVRDVTYDHCTATGDTYGFSTHQNCISAHYNHCHALGKHGHTHRARYVYIDGGLVDSSLSGQVGIGTTEACKEIYVRRVTFRGPQQHFAAANGSTARSDERVFVIEECEFPDFRGFTVAMAEPLSRFEFVRNRVVTPDDGAALTYRAAVARFDGNQFLNSNGGVITQANTSLATDKTYIERNSHTGTKHATESALIYARKGELYFSDNSIDIDGFRAIRVFDSDCVIRQLIGNRIRQMGLVVQVSGAVTVTVDLSAFNVFANAAPFGSDVTVTVQYLDYPMASSPTLSDGDTGGTGSAGSGNQYVELEINGTIYKVLHDGTVS